MQRVTRRLTVKLERLQLIQLRVETGNGEEATLELSFGKSCGVNFICEESELVVNLEAKIIERSSNQLTKRLRKFQINHGNKI